MADKTMMDELARIIGVDKERQDRHDDTRIAKGDNAHWNCYAEYNYADYFLDDFQT